MERTAEWMMSEACQCELSQWCRNLEKFGEVQTFAQMNTLKKRNHHLIESKVKF